MSILQEYEQIKKEMGDYKWNLMNEYIDKHNVLLSDVIYKKDEYTKFNDWIYTDKADEISKYLISEGKTLIENQEGITNIAEYYVILNKEEILASTVAYLHEEDYICVEPLKDKYYFSPEWDYNFDNYFFSDVEKNVIAFVSADTHYNLWCSIAETYPLDLECKEGLQVYLKYCKDNNITLDQVSRYVDYNMVDVMKYQHDEPIHIQEKTVLMTGVRNGETPIALIQRDIGGFMEYEFVVTIDYEINDDKMHWGQGFYYGKDFKGALNDYERAIDGNYLTGQSQKREDKGER